MSTPYAQTSAIKQALIDVFTSNMGASGMIYGVKSVGGTNFNETGQPVYIGIDTVQIPKPDFSSIHKLRHEIEFAINISVKSTDRLIDARNALEPFLDDGAGNGVLAVLRGIYHSLLGGRIEKCDIGQILFLNNVGLDTKSPPTAFFCDAVVYFNVFFTVNI